MDNLRKRYVSAMNFFNIYVYIYMYIGTSLDRWDGKGPHPFPVKVQSDGGELLTTRYIYEIMCINISL
jgi:hypothetical protein